MKDIEELAGMPMKTLTSAAYRIAMTAAAVSAAIGISVLCGWGFGITFLTVIFPGAQKMAASTAVCQIVAGIALWSIARLADPADVRATGFNWGIVQQILLVVGACFVAGVGILKLLEYETGNSLGVDTLLFQSAPDLARMAPATALSFLMLGIALLLSRTRWAVMFQLLSLLGGFLSWLALTQFFYGGEALIPLAKMAVHTAGAFVILNLGLLCARPDIGLMRLLTSNSAAGLISRRLVPAALFVPTILGWLRIQAQRAGWFGTEAGVSIFALSSILSFGVLIWLNAALLDRSDTRRRQADARAYAQLERLSLLQQITRAIGERQDMQSIFQAAIQRLEDQLPMDLCCICLYDAGTSQLSVAAVGPRSAALTGELEMGPGARIDIGQNGLSQCVRGQLVYEPNVNEVRFPFPQRLARAGLRALACAPLQVENQIFGLLLVARRQRDSFTSSDCEFFKQLSEHIALAAHQAELNAALKQAYEDLRATQDAVMQQERLRALGQMASGIAHDINNAISPVALYTEILLEKEPLSERAREYLTVTQRAIEDVTHTIGRMREFYRRGETALQLEPVDLNQMIRQVLDLTRARWSDMPQQRGIVIDVRALLTPELPRIAGVESEIREALTNLVFNAVDAMPEGGTLTLRTTVRTDDAGHGAEKIWIEIADTGAGMSEETRRRCLEPFYTTKGERGTGLGLAMVYGIAQRHNADLSIESQLGQGTTIRLAFQSGVGKDTAPSADAARLPAGLRLLVVDDDPLLIKSLLDTLLEDGHSVVAARGGQEGIDLFRSAEREQSHFSAVITDLGMPYVDGRKVAAAVKAASPVTPVILLTGWGQRLTTEGEVPQHVDCVLNKPPKLRDLRSALTKLCSS